MEYDDLELEQRVWQRITGGSREPSPLEPLIAEEEEAAAVYRHLAAREPGSSHRLQQLARRSRDHAAILQGMIALSGRQRQSRRAPLPRPESPAALLTGACRSCAALAKRYQELSGHGEFGCVFEQFAAQTADTLAALLAIAGEKL